MMNRLLEELAAMPGVITRTGQSKEHVQQLIEREGILLPDEHRQLLQTTDGLSAFAGYFRLLGVNSAIDYNLGWWNSFNCWKFAWASRCLGFWCFGETAWGDQYAYSIEELKRGSPRVYFLDALSMEARIIAPDFRAFIVEEFMRNAKSPYDEMTVKARSVLGEVDDASLLVYSPSLLLGGDEQIENVQRINARSAMIVNGDIATQVDGVTDEMELEEVRTVCDEEGRTRVQLVWKS